MRILVVLIGLAWHLGHAETASAFWLGIGFSPAHSRCLAIIGGMITSWGFCEIGFFLKTFPRSKIHRWLIAHQWVSKLPYFGIIILGLLLPAGGVVIGILIAREMALPRLSARCAILGTNLIKLCGWGTGITLLSPYIQHVAKAVGPLFH